MSDTEIESGERKQLRSKKKKQNTTEKRTGGGKSDREDRKEKKLNKRSRHTEKTKTGGKLLKISNKKKQTEKTTTGGETDREASEKRKEKKLNKRKQTEKTTTGETGEREEEKEKKKLSKRLKTEQLSELSDSQSDSLLDKEGETTRQFLARIKIKNPDGEQKLIAGGYDFLDKLHRAPPKIEQLQELGFNLFQCKLILKEIAPPKDYTVDGAIAYLQTLNFEQRKRIFADFGLSNSHANEEHFITRVNQNLINQCLS